MKNRVPSVLLALALLLAVSPLAAQPAADTESLRKEIQSLKAGQQQIQKDIEEIKKILQAARNPAPAAPDKAVNAMVNIAGEPSKGNKDARLTLIEFSEYQCPFCSRHVQNTFPQLDKEYIQTGKAKLVFRDLPLESIHKNAFKASEAAHCAGDQGKYWEMHDRLFSNQQALEASKLTEHATAIGIDAKKFQACVDGGKYAAEIRKDIADAERLGVSATPTTLIAVSQPNDSNVKVVKVIRGAQSYAVFKAALDELLSPPPPAAKQ
ncbi:MAG: DsbA family protein [Acidobacteriota bacterium]|nr:DsbA family protein [Acidobacteriota bacterium]